MIRSNNRLVDILSRYQDMSYKMIGKEYQNEADELREVVRIQKGKADELEKLAIEYSMKIDEINQKIDAIHEENKLLRETEFRSKRVIKMLLSVLATFPVKDEFDLQDIFDCHLIDGLSRKG